MDVGHYVACCKRENRWFKFDDDKVTLVWKKGVLECDPYLLYYMARNSSGAEEDDCGGDNGTEAKGVEGAVDEEDKGEKTADDEEGAEGEAGEEVVDGTKVRKPIGMR